MSVEKLKQSDNVLYVKLGSANADVERCFLENQVRIGFGLGDETLFNHFQINSEASWREIRSMLIQRHEDNNQGGNPNSFAGNILGQLKRARSGACAKTLWVTFSGGKLYWSTPNEGATWERSEEAHGAILTNCEWSSIDAKGREINQIDLPGSIVATSQYKGTICTPRYWKHIISVISCEEDKDCASIRKQLSELYSGLASLVRRLQPKDFELLIELLFSRSGWQRVGKAGGNVRDIDLMLHLPTTKENACVQIKSTATQQTFENYVRNINEWDADIFFWIQHSKTEYLRDSAFLNKIQSNSNKRIFIWDERAIAEHVVSAGLIEWVTDKVLVE